MNAGEFLESLKEFFLDAIGTVIPGLVALIGTALVVPSLRVSLQSGFLNPWLTVVWSYVIGNGILGVAGPIQKALGWLGDRVGSKRFRSHRKMESCIQSSDSYHNFRKLVGSPIKKGDSKDEFHSWRNEAMTIASEEKHTVYRFTFISLFHTGIATSLLLTPVLWVILLLLESIVTLPVDVLNLSTGTGLAISACAFAASIPFWSRSFEFRARSLRVPFSMASAFLRAPDKGVSNHINNAVTTDVGEPEKSSTLSDNHPTVYLAGGFRSGWQDQIAEECVNLNLIDPSQHGLRPEEEYTTWDLEAIRLSDIVFAYAEATNPSLYGLALEIGFAKALGKTIVLVDEKTPKDPITGRYLGMVRSSSDVSFDKFSDGLDYLKKFQSMGN
jgi:hypothetical protein